MIAEIKKLLSSNATTRYAAFPPPNDTVYATPRDYYEDHPNENIKGQVAGFRTNLLVLLVRTQHHLSHEITSDLKRKLLERINKMGGCRLPKDIFWSLGAPVNPGAN